MIKTEELNEVLKNATKKNGKSCGLGNLPMELGKFGGNELKIQDGETEMVINVH